MIFTIEVDLALFRPPAIHRMSRVIIDSCCASHAEIDAISMASQIHRAEMPIGSRIIDWEE